MHRGAKQAKAAPILQQLRKCFDLSREDLGTMFGVTGEVIASWEQDAVEIPDTALAKMIAASASLDRMLWFFRPDRLPQVIRRRAEAFDGERALDWILDGRLAEVAERYYNGLAYLRRTA